MVILNLMVVSLLYVRSPSNRFDETHCLNKAGVRDHFAKLILMRKVIFRHSELDVLHYWP